MAFSLSDHPFTAAIFGKAWANKLVDQQLSIEDIQALYEFFNDISSQTSRLTALIADKNLDKKITKPLRQLNEVALKTSRREKLPILQYWVCELVPIISPDTLYHLIEQCLAYEASLYLRRTIGTDFLRSSISPAANLMRASMADVLHPGSSRELQAIHKIASSKLRPISYDVPTEKTIAQIDQRLISLYYKYAVLAMRQQTQLQQCTQGYAEGALKYFLTLGVMGFYVDYWIGRETTEKKKHEANTHASAVLKAISQESHPVMKALVERFSSENQHLGKLAIVEELISFDLPESEILRIYQMLSENAQLVKTAELENKIKTAYEEVGNLSLQNLDDLHDEFMQSNKSHGKQEKLAADIKTLRAILTFKILILLDPDNPKLTDLKDEILSYSLNRGFDSISISDLPTANLSKESKKIEELRVYVKEHLTNTLSPKGLDLLQTFEHDSFKRATIRGQLKKLTRPQKLSINDQFAVLWQSVNELHSPLIEKKLRRDSMIHETPRPLDTPEISIKELLHHSPDRLLARRGSTDSSRHVKSPLHSVAYAANSPRRSQTIEDVRHFASPVPILSPAPTPKQKGRLGSILEARQDSNEDLRWEEGVSFQ